MNTRLKLEFDTKMSSYMYIDLSIDKQKRELLKCCGMQSQILSALTSTAAQKKPTWKSDTKGAMKGPMASMAPEHPWTQDNSSKSRTIIILG